jgi:hypothetical protein
MDKLTDEEIRKLREMADTWEQVHLASRVLEWLGKLLGWFAGIVMAAVAAWTVFKTGNGGR